MLKKDLEVLKKDLEVFEKDERVFLKDPGLLSGNCYHEKPSAFFIITVLCDRFYPCNTFHINVVVSDGYNVVQTDEQGRYYIQSDKKSGFVFISVQTLLPEENP